MYCYVDDKKSSWATVQDLYLRYGEEFVDKLAIRSKWNATANRYVMDESVEGKFEVICAALKDAKAWILQKLMCEYGNTDILDAHAFPAVKQWHIILTIETLKIGGDCSACACNESIDKWVACGTICADGVCLESNKCFVSVSPAHFPCEGCGCGGCSCCP